jgi:hypothetical protein
MEMRSMANEPPARPRAEQDAWEEHNLSQLRYFRSLSLREKMQAVEGMADVLRRFEEMRARGELTYPGRGRAQAAAPELREPPPPDDQERG